MTEQQMKEALENAAKEQGMEPNQSQKELQIQLEQSEVLSSLPCRCVLRAGIPQSPSAASFEHRLRRQLVSSHFAFWYTVGLTG